MQRYVLRAENSQLVRLRHTPNAAPLCAHQHRFSRPLVFPNCQHPNISPSPQNPSPPFPIYRGPATDEVFKSQLRDLPLARLLALTLAWTTLGTTNPRHEPHSLDKQIIRAILFLSPRRRSDVSRIAGSLDADLQRAASPSSEGDEDNLRFFAPADSREPGTPVVLEDLLNSFVCVLQGWEGRGARGPGGGGGAEDGPTAWEEATVFVDLITEADKVEAVLLEKEQCRGSSPRESCWRVQLLKEPDDPYNSIRYEQSAHGLPGGENSLIVSVDESQIEFPPYHPVGRRRDLVRRLKKYGIPYVRRFDELPFVMGEEMPAGRPGDWTETERRVAEQGNKVCIYGKG